MHKNRKPPQDSRKLPLAREKVCNENERNKKNDVHVKILLMEGSPFFYKTHIQKTGENNFDKHRVNDSGHNESTICLVNR